MLSETKSKKSKEYDGYNRTLYNKFCECCNKEFYIPKHIFNKTRFCSIKCKSKIQERNIDIICSLCSSLVKRKRSSLYNSKSGLYFCNRNCKEKAQRIGGIKEIQPDHYGTANGKYSYRAKALKDFPNKCNRCGYDKYIRMLDVHHMDSNRENNVIENLEILCVWCHALHTRKIKDIYFPGE